jgi:hypothetical protein
MAPHQMPKMVNQIKLLEKLSNLNINDAVQSIIIIIILFTIFSNCYFKNACKGLPFLCLNDGEFNIQSLIILGFIFGICYVIVKNYII